MGNRKLTEIEALCREAFFEGVSEGGDSSPHDRDHDAIMKTMDLCFRSWWKRNEQRAVALLRRR